MGTGRSSELIKKRDAALIRRYHYWTEVQRLRFDDALRILSKEEFFLSEQRIMTIIRTAASLGEEQCKPVPKVRMPRLTRDQLNLLQNDSEKD